MEIFDIQLLGVSREGGLKLLLTLLLLIAVNVFRRLLHAVAWLFGYRNDPERVDFWIRQSIDIVAFVVLVLGAMSIWFDQADRLAAALGILTVALGFGLQRVVLAIAGYIALLRGRPYAIGDRVGIGDLRGDVIDVGFVHTSIREMGDQSPTSGDPQSRQYTGRVVTLSNAQIFEDLVHNFTRDFPYVWEEIAIPIAYSADRNTAEKVLLDAASRHTVKIADAAADVLLTPKRPYFVEHVDLQPRVYYQLADDRLELIVRFLARDRRVRELKDTISRDILQGLEREGIELAPVTRQADTGQ